MTDRVLERLLATQPGYVPASQRPRRKVTHVATYHVGAAPASAKWEKTGAPYRDDEGDMVQNWYWIEFL